MMKMLRYLQIPILSFPCKRESRKRYFKKAWIPAFAGMTKKVDKLILESLSLHSRYNRPGMIIPRCNPSRRYNNDPRINVRKMRTI